MLQTHALAAYVCVVQAAAYYLGMLAYYWVLATPAVGFLFGCYLYIAVNWFHVHYDEAFSALRIPNFKGFSRLHINRDGDLEVYGLAMDKVTQKLLMTNSSKPWLLHGWLHGKGKAALSPRQLVIDSVPACMICHGRPIWCYMIGMM